MAETIPVVNTATDTFQIWINRTNQTINVISTDALTANSTLGITTGNALVNGIFGANTLFVTAALRGGTVSTPAAMNVVSNLNSNAVVGIGNSTVNVFANSSLLQVANSTVTANLGPGSLVIGTSTVNSTALVAGANVFVNASTISVGNSTSNLLANSILILLTNATSTTSLSPGLAAIGVSSINTTAFVEGANVFLDTVKLSIGNTTANLLANSLLITVANSTATSNLQPGALVIGSSTVNTTAVSSPSHVAGANVTLSTVSLSMGNSTANLFANSILVEVANASGTANLQPTQLVIGTSTVNSTAHVAGANVFLDTTKLSVGNSTANLLANSILVSLANASGIANLQPTQLVIGTSVVNGTQVTLNANLQANSTALQIGNSSVNCVVNSTVIAFNGTPFASGMKVAQNSTSTFSETRINFVAGNNITLNITDDSGDGQVNVQINAAAATGAGIVGGSDTWVQFNDGGSAFGGTVGFTYDKSSNNLFLGNTFLVGANVSLDRTKLFVGNTIANLLANSITLVLANSTSTSTLTPLSVNLGNSTANVFANSITVVVANATATHSITPSSFLVGNSTANLLANSILVSLANSTSIANLNPVSLLIGTAVVNSTTVVTGSLITSNGSAITSGFNVTTAGTSAANVDFWDITAYRAAQYFFTVKDETANAYHTGSIHVLNDGTNGQIEEYGVVVSNTDLGKFSTTANSTAIILQFTSSAISTTIKGLKTLIPV